MNKDAEYRRKAIECAEAAERAHDLHERLELLEMAQAWIKLAEHTRALHTLPDPIRKIRPHQESDAVTAEETEQ